MRTTLAGATSILVLSLVLSGCAASTPGASSSPPAADDRTPSAVPSPSARPTEAPDVEATPGAYVEYTDGAVEATAGAKVLFFHAPWCPQCRKLDEELLAQGAPDGLTVFKVDYDSRTDLRQRYGVTLQTTVVFVDDSGEQLSSSVLYDDPSIASLVAVMP